MHLFSILGDDKMASKRQKKKRQKQELQRKELARKKQTKKEIRRYTYKQLESREEKRQKNKEYKENTFKKKREYLESLGVDTHYLTKTEINSVKMKDIKNDNVRPDNYTYIYYLEDNYDKRKRKTFDYGTEVTLKNNMKIYCAYCDVTGEHCLEDIFRGLENMSNDELYDRLRFLVNLHPIRGKGSNGKAGIYRWICDENEFITAVKKETRNANRRKKTKAHKGTYKGYQTVKRRGQTSITKVTGRFLLMLAVAMMDNVTQLDRENFYLRFYRDMSKAYPEFVQILPRP